MPRIAVVSARAARGLDEDEGLLITALQALGAHAEVVAWDDASVDWGAFTLAVLRSTWDYTHRLAEFLDWAGRAAALTRLESPLPLVRWNTDKRYLTQLAQALPDAVIPARVIAPGEDIGKDLDGLLAQESYWVVKPAVGAGSKDVQRHPATAQAAIMAHIERLHASGSSVLVQPYLESVERDGETALVFMDGAFSHAIRKGPMLGKNGVRETDVADLFAQEQITPRTPGADELALAGKLLAALQALPVTAAGSPPLLYARVDLIRDAHGQPRLLELEVCEPSLFLSYAPGAAARFAGHILKRTSG